MPYETSVKCPLCHEGTIVGEIEWVSTADPLRTPIGPSGADYEEPRIIDFHCSSCQIVFHHPPGMPDAREELLREVKRSRRKERYGW
jgi:hypothetical protein